MWAYRFLYNETFSLVGLKTMGRKSNLQSYNKVKFSQSNNKNKGDIVMKRGDMSSLAHVKWDYKYHVVQENGDISSNKNGYRKNTKKIV